MKDHSRWPALDGLDDRLKVNGVQADAQKVASTILGLARINGWNSQPEKFVAWLEQLALDVGHSGAGEV